MSQGLSRMNRGLLPGGKSCSKLWILCNDDWCSRTLTKLFAKEPILLIAR
jgi:hypothetical protein